jgi:hypothetical protein
MACPFFEPLAPVLHPESRNGRLPLIQEYEGTCHASGTGTNASGSVCNHGYAQGQCERYPNSEPSVALRYSVLHRNGGELQLMCIAEENHSPVRSMRLHFSSDLNGITERDLEACLMAQAVAFGRSYLRIIASTHNDTSNQPSDTVERPQVA